MPIACNVAKEPMLDLIPLAGAGRVVAKFDGHARLVGQLLQSPSPKSRSGAIATATAGC